MKQYEIRWANLPAPIGRRPVLLLTRTSGYAYLNKVIVAEVTPTVRDIPSLQRRCSVPTSAPCRRAGTAS